MNRRTFNRNAALLGVCRRPRSLRHRSRAGAEAEVGVILPRSGYLGLIGQSCQKGADLAPGVIKEMLGVDIELMNADFEINVDTARTRAERLIQEGAQRAGRAVRLGRRLARSRRSPSSAACRS